MFVLGFVVQAEISRLKSENESQQHRLESCLHDYEKKMRGTQEFLDKKEHLESEISDLKSSLEQKARESFSKIRCSDEDPVAALNTSRPRTDDRVGAVDADAAAQRVVHHSIRKRLCGVH